MQFTARQVMTGLRPGHPRRPTTPPFRVPDVENDRACNPVMRVHVDQTATSGVTRLQHTFPDPAATLLRHRESVAADQVAGSRCPLAVCDARSVAPRERIRETFVARFSALP